MKYTAKPVTQNARNKKADASPTKYLETPPAKKKIPPPAAAPAVPSQGSNSSSNKQSRITTTRERGDDNMMYDVTRESSNSSSDANTLENVAGKIIGGGYKGKKMSNDAWVKYLANETPEQKAKRQAREVKDGVREAPKQSTSTNSKSSSKETWKPVMTEAVEATEGVQTHRYEQARQRNSYMRKNFWSTQGAKKTMKKMQKEGYMNADGSFTDSGKANLSNEQRGALNITRDTSLGINKQQLAFKNQTGVWAPGGNTKVGNKFERTEGKAPEHMKAPNTGTSTTKKKGVSRSVMTDPGVQTPTVENNPNSVKDTKVDAKGLDPRATHTYGANTPQVKRSGPDFKGELDKRLMEENVFNDQLSEIEQSSRPGMMGDAVGNFKMSRLHSSKSPAKMWGPSKVKAGKGGFNRKK